MNTLFISRLVKYPIKVNSMGFKTDIKSAILVIALKIFIIQNVHAHILRLPCLKYGNFMIVTSDRSLNGHVLQTFNNLSEDECEDKCVNHGLCKSINIKYTAGANCELNGKSTEDPFDAVQLSSNIGWVYKTTDYKARAIGHYCQHKNSCPNYFGITCIDSCYSPGYMCQQTTTAAFKHCQEAYKQGNLFSAIYPIHKDGTGFFYLPCDMVTNGGGWVVFQRRVDASVDFYLGWNEYRQGFGDLNGNFWLGLEKIHRFAAPGKGASLRVELKHINSPNVPIYAEYSKFEISNEAGGYTLVVGGYSGNATDSLSLHNGMRFQTKDSAINTCARAHKGAWWYLGCHYSHLNGIFPTQKAHTDPKYNSWYTLHYEYGGIIFSEMKLRYSFP